MKIRFTKMQGLGNDFVVIDATKQPLALNTAQWRALADRHFGVGADQILIVEQAQGDADFRYRIFNNDGGEVEQCGNGARCFVRFVHDQGLTTKRAIRVETLGGLIEPRLEDDGQVTVDMGVPRFTPESLPYLPAHTQPAQEAHQMALLGPSSGRALVALVTLVSMGNPHAVQVVANVDDAPVLEDGPWIEHHAAFPKRVNAGFMQIISRRAMRLRVFERGAGETLACGTGACAAVVAAVLRGLVDTGEAITVSTRGGDLSIRWAGLGQPVLMTGPAVTVFEGAIEIA
jgi:diaminopimelate epimerase